jgi:hypothetical protein
MVAALLVVHQTRLDSARPVLTEGKSLAARAMHQDVEARLWQDPLFAIAQFRERRRAEAAQESQLRRQSGNPAAPVTEEQLPPDQQHDFSTELKSWVEQQMCPEDKSKAESVRLLMPMVMGGRSEEDAEMRRRTRYAVVSGLMNSQFNPFDPDAISYAHVPKSLRGSDGRDDLLPEVLPFEWFKRPAANGTDKTDWILVVWLDQSNFHAWPLSRLRNLIEKLAPSCISQDRKEFAATVLGPVDSEMLTLIQADFKNEEPTTAGTRVHFISASATKSLAGSQFYLKSASGAATFARVIGPDEKLVEALIGELDKRVHRGVSPSDPNPAVIVISEHDTDYGRDLVRLLSKEKRYDVRAFSYLRQIDGGLGNAQRSAKGADREREHNQEKSEQRPQLRSHGSSQVDYLARLVHDIEHYSDGDGKTARDDKRDVVAIAMFGNDVYDKLLVLRALRPAFPKAIFLTTDLDARLLDPEESEWTRNLVVATNFSLTLDRQVQLGASPFRDGYQTATYFAAWLIGGNCATEVMRKYGEDNRIPPWLQSPLLFEIGRHRAIPLETNSPAPVDLTSFPFDPAESGAPASPRKGCWFGDIAELPNPASVQIQPLLSKPQLPGKQKLVLAVVAAILLSSLAWVTSRYPVVLRQGFVADRQWPRVPLMAASSGLLGAAVGGALIALIGRLTEKPSWFLPEGVMFALFVCIGLWLLRQGLEEGKSKLVCLGSGIAGTAIALIIWCTIPAITVNDEPFSWFDGISVWPTQLLRLLAAIFAIFSLWHIASASADSMEDIEKRFGLGAPFDPPPEGRPSMQYLWKTYALRRSSRIAKTIGFALFYYVVCVFLLLLFDARPGIPVRGSSAPIAALLGFAAFMGIVLLVGMIYACAAFILEVIRPATKAVPEFPSARVTAYREMNGLPLQVPSNQRFIECALEVELVAERSRTLIGLIHFPFVVFALMIIARSAVFDNWDTPMGLWIVLGLPFLVVIGCVVWLRLETKAFHRKVIGAAKTQLISLRGSSSGVSNDHIKQLETLFEAMRDEDRGSFQNLALQPIVRALLFPVGGFSGIGILEHFVLAR